MTNQQQKYYDKIPHDLVCNNCGKNRDETKFRFKPYKDSGYINPTCGACLYRFSNPCDGDRKERESKKPGDALHWDKIPDDHKCINCYRDKSEVNFKVNFTLKGSPYADKWCNKCIHVRAKKSVKPKNIINSTVKERIKEYFKENY